MCVCGNEWAGLSRQKASTCIARRSDRTWPIQRLKREKHQYGYGLEEKQEIGPYSKQLTAIFTYLTY